ncbi:MAG: purine-binding chemotaxis protein CheW [Clostridiales bacterium]|nr:purine-binding chemotaxis protein CheW [Clostridiales bacterium]
MTQLDMEKTTSQMDGKYLTFFTAQQLFGIPLMDIVQIIEMQEITPIPGFPHYAKGMIEFQGSIIPLVDMRLRMGKVEADYNERTCIIVASIQKKNIGFIVDEVDEVISIAEDAIVSPPQMSGDGINYLRGIAKLKSQIALLIDTRKIIGRDELGILTSVSL